MHASAQRLDRQANRKMGVHVPFLASFLLLLLTAGCARFARQQPLPLPAVASFGCRALTDTGLKRFMEQQQRAPLDQWPLPTWNLPRLTLAAYYFHPRLVAARSQWQQAEAELAVARGGPESTPPEVDSFWAWKQPVLPPVVGPETGPARPGTQGLSATNPLVEAPTGPPTKRGRRIAEAERSAASARFQLDAVSWEVRAGVRSNLLDYVALLRGETLLEELEDTGEKLVRSAELRIATGSMSYWDLSRLRLQLAQIRLVLIRTRLEKMDSRVRLADALALPVPALFDAEVDYDFSRGAERTWSAPDLRRQALRNRLDISKALADYAAAEAEVRAELAKRHLSPDLPAGCWWDSRKNRWEASLDLWLPAEHPGVKRVARAEARRIAAAARLLNLQTDIIDEVERSAAAFRVTAEEVAGIDALVGLIARNYTATREQFEAGDAEVPEVLLAQMQVLAASVFKLEAQVKLHNAQGALENALQRPAEAISYASSFQTSRPTTETQ